MNNKLSILLAASVFALAACNSPTAEQEANEAATDPVQSAYEEGKANAAGAIGETAANVSAEMKDEQAEAEAEAAAEVQD